MGYLLERHLRNVILKLGEGDNCSRGLRPPKTALSGLVKPSSLPANSCPILRIIAAPIDCGKHRGSSPVPSGPSPGLA